MGTLPGAATMAQQPWADKTILIVQNTKGQNRHAALPPCHAASRSGDGFALPFQQACDLFGQDAEQPAQNK